MSHAFSASDPQPYSINLPPRMQDVLAVGAVGIALGLLGLCTLPMIAEPVTSDYLGRGGVIVDRGAINTWGLISSNTGLVLAAVALIGGMGCLRFRAWARPLMLGYSALSLLLGLAGIYFHILIIQAGQSGGSTPEFVTRFASLFEWVAWVVGSLFGGTCIWVLTRQGVREAFARGRAVA